jgi:hypothetical protein
VNPDPPNPLLGKSTPIRGSNPGKFDIKKSKPTLPTSWATTARAEPDLTET